MNYGIEMDGPSQPETGQPDAATLREAKIANKAAEYEAFIQQAGPAVAARRWAEEQVQAEENQAKAKEKNELLQKQADRDPYNPRIYSALGWNRVMKDKVAELRRNKKGAMVITWDLDGFKTYNDSYQSHVEGDKALGLAGDLAKSVLRPGDIIARLHGDEFIALVETNAPEDAILIAERMRAATAEMPTLLSTPIQLRASLGITRLSEKIIQTNYGSDEDSDEVFVEDLKGEYDRADHVMYIGAKRAGGDRIGIMLDNSSIQTAVVTPVEGQHRPTITYEEPKAALVSSTRH